MNNQLTKLTPPLNSEHITRLFHAQQEITNTHFEHIYGSDLGNHLWGKFIFTWQGNLILFLYNQDARTQALFLHWLCGGY